jgi:hypothetical protein
MTSATSHNPSTFSSRWSELRQAASLLGAALFPGRFGRAASRLDEPLRAQNGRGDGPPDLDELWRDFNRKLSGLFGGRGGGPRGGNGAGDPNGGPSFQPNLKSAGVGAALIGGVVVLIWLGSGVFIVQEGQQAVVTVSVSSARNGQRHAAAHQGDRPQFGQPGHGPARFLDADAGRKHRRHPLHGAVPDQERA